MAATMAEGSCSRTSVTSALLKMAVNRCCGCVDPPSSRLATTYIQAQLVLSLLCLQSVANAMMDFQLKMADSDYPLKFVMNAGDSFYHRGVTQLGE